MNSHQLPASNQSIHASRNRLICKLFEHGLSPEKISRLNAVDVRLGAMLVIRISTEFYGVQLTGAAPKALIDYQVLRAKRNPRSGALILALSGKTKGQRLSVKAIQRIIAKQADSKPLNIRFGEHSEKMNDKQDDNTQNQPVFRLIQGGG